MITREKLRDWVSEHKGVLVAKSALVYRNTYFGNDVIAKNSTLSYADERGYVPVELWIMSMVEAENTLRKRGEGMTYIQFDTETASLAELRTLDEPLLFGNYAAEWPLTKILDIGGAPVKTSFGTEEVPPIPVHFHPYKTEAYFFPPISVPPYNRTQPHVITRIGLKAGVTKEEFKNRLLRFGEDDSMFELLNEFAIEPNTGWTVLEKTLHAPGPYITFEIQRPADDYHNASWRLGERLDVQEKHAKYHEHVLQNIPHESALINEVLNWEHATDQTLHERFFHAPQHIQSDLSGNRHQIFFDMFYGEAWEIFPQQTMSIDAKVVPQAGIVWSGTGTINGNVLSPKGLNEFFVVPHTHLSITNTGETPLLVYTVEPIR